VTPILTFTRQELGREVAMLGVVQVGEVMRQLGRPAQASYAVWLPDVPKSFRPAPSVSAARSAVQAAIDDWLLRIGVFYPGQGVDVQVPEAAEELKEARAG
jgi:hypothetical protein